MRLDRYGGLHMVYLGVCHFSFMWWPINVHFIMFGVISSYIVVVMSSGVWVVLKPFILKTFCGLPILDIR